MDVSVVIPAYQEENIIGKVVGEVKEVLEELGKTHEVIVVDDGSSDQTPTAAEQAGAAVISHPYNIGNGAAVKTGIRAAQGASIVMMDGDGQHDAAYIPALLDGLETYDMVVGARNADSETSVHRDIGNGVYNWLASYVCDRQIDDLTSGYRALRATIAKKFVYLLPNTFSYPTTITMAVARSGYSFSYYPIRVRRRVGKSKIKLLRDGARFLLILFKIATLFSPLKIFIPVSLLVFGVGFGYGLYKVLVLGTRYGPTSAMLMTMAGLVFLIGLVSEQVTQLRFERNNFDSAFESLGNMSRKEEL
jgi:glycosyltransferase involved in cell wall biosynthesis